MLTAFEQGGVEAAVGFFDQDVLLHVPGRNQLAGEYKGVDELLGFGQRRSDLAAGTFTAEVHDIADSGDHATAMFFVRAERNGKTYRYRQVNVYHLRNGKIIEVFMVPMEQDVVDELFG